MLSGAFNKLPAPILSGASCQKGFVRAISIHSCEAFLVCLLFFRA
jgi:hypothetical protein